VWMTSEELFIALFDESEPILDPRLQRDRLHPGAFLGKLLIIGYPFINFGLGDVVSLHELPKLTFNGIVSVRNLKGETSLLLNEIAECHRLVRGQQRPQQSAQQIVHFLAAT